MSESSDHRKVCPTCRRKLPGRPRRVLNVPDVPPSGELVKAAAAGRILGGLTAAQVRRMDRELQPVRGASGCRLYDRAKLEALAGQLPPARADDLSSEWLSFRTVVRIIGLQEQSIRDADDRLKPIRAVRPDGSLGPRRYHRSFVYQELIRLGRVRVPGVGASSGEGTGTDS